MSGSQKKKAKAAKLLHKHESKLKGFLDSFFHRLERTSGTTSSSMSENILWKPATS